MTYTPTNWSSGDTITSAKLNKIEQELSALDSGKQDSLTIDNVVSENSTNPVSGGAVYSELNNKQDSLTIDNVVTESSTNPVTGGAVYSELAEKQDKLTFDSTPTQNSTNPVTSGGVYSELNLLKNDVVQELSSFDSEKQDKLTFDTTPKNNSKNPVTSGGIYTELYSIKENINNLNSNKQDILGFDSVPNNNSTNPVTSKGIYQALSAKQNTLTFDPIPVENSNNPVLSGGIYASLSGKQNSLTFDTTPIHDSANPITSGGVYEALAAIDSGQDFVKDEIYYFSSTDTRLKNGRIKYHNGEITNNTSNYFQYLELEVEAGDSITFTTDPTGSYYSTDDAYKFGYAFYDANRNYIYGAPGDVDTLITVIAPLNAKYFRYSRTRTEFDKTAYSKFEVVGAGYSYALADSGLTFSSVARDDTSYVSTKLITAGTYVQSVRAYVGRNDAAGKIGFIRASDNYVMKTVTVISRIGWNDFQINYLVPDDCYLAIYDIGAYFAATSTSDYDDCLFGSTLYSTTPYNFQEGSYASKYVADSSGNKYIFTINWMYKIPNKTDVTFSKLGFPADAKYTGDRFSKLETKTITVDINGNGDYTSFSEGVIRAYTDYTNAVVKVRYGVYNVYEELKTLYGSTVFDDMTDENFAASSINLKNGVQIMCEPGTTITFHYDGSNTSVMSKFSVLNFDRVACDIYIENLKVECSKIRYAVHDDYWDNTNPYKHSFKGCSFEIDNSANTAWNTRCAYGCGFGAHGCLDFEDCTFASADLPSAKTGNGSVYIHNSPAANAVSRASFRNCYFAGDSTLHLNYYGDSTILSDIYVSGCSVGSAIEIGPEGETTNNNLNVVAFNNEVRS